MTRLLLTCGIIAGPIYVITVGIQTAIRDGFDFTRHPASLLSNGDLGWIQIANFVVAGLLVVAAAAGLYRTLSTGRGSKWGPLLLGMYGAGLILSGVFVADPMEGFPPGTPAGDPESVSLSGVMHLLAGGVAFFSLVAACLVLARRFYSQSAMEWTVFSLGTGAFTLLSFAFIAVFPGESFSTLLLTASVLLGWSWISLLCWSFIARAATSVAAPAAS